MTECMQTEAGAGAAAAGGLARLVGAELEGLMPDGAVPERVVVTPWGMVESTNGSFVVDEEAGAAVVAAFTAHGTDLPIDFEHQTLGGAYASPQGTAPAAGWITALAAVPGEGIVATVNWTEEGRRMLASRAYRYLSPVALIRPEDRRMIGLHSVALTNKPAIVRMVPVVNRENPMTGPDAAGVVAALSARLALPADTDTATLLAAAESRLAALEVEARRQEAERSVAAAQAAGKLTAAQREWALALAESDPSSFAEWARTAPVVVTPGRMPAPTACRGAADAARARREYRADRLLQALTSEEAYVAEVLRTQQG